ncbi:hypothetical protein [Saliterribacillus persicus]|uniref:Uncharacterized protein n=1 Tax=Saliterribacillus persicus TaxID=930114 RepID=A0A368XD37_9BACI|nr:hypothetical protein [Saliterribacillus persicus]RCW65881.1 hypothetical protein DFR57_11099 [Saliterribacillus persicus]
MKDDKIMKLKNVSFRHEKGWAIEHVNSPIGKGQYLGLVVTNGSRKCTLRFVEMEDFTLRFMDSLKRKGFITLWGCLTNV